MLIIILKIKNSRIELSGHTEVLRLIDNTFRLWTTNEDDFLFFNKLGNKLEVPIGYYELLIYFCILNKIKIVQHDHREAELLKITPIWKEILTSGYNEVNGKSQLYYLEKLIENPRGLAQLFTSYGKTELFLAIIEAFLQSNPDKNVLILVPSSSIKSEFFQRVQKWKCGFELNDTDFSTNVTILNPNGFIKSSKNNKELLEEYYSKVDLILVDEVQKSTSTSYLRLLLDLSPKYQYGVSGTINKNNSQLPSASQVLLMDQNIPDVYNYLVIVSHFGFPKFELVNPTKVEVAYIRDHFAKIHPRYLNNYMHCITKVLSSMTLALNLKLFLDSNPTRTVYIPIPQKKAGLALRDNLMNLFYPDYSKADESTVIFFSSKEIYPRMNYEEVKSSLLGNTRVLISTSASEEGFNSEALDTILMTFGRSNGKVNQNVGRAGRNRNSENKLVALFPFELGKNYILNSQTKKKYRLLHDSYESVTFKNFFDYIQ